MKIPAFAFFLIVFISSGLNTSSQPLPLSVRSVKEQVDGIESKYLEFTGSEISLRRLAGGSWFLLEETAAGASVSFAHRFLPDVLMHLSVVKSDQLIESLDEQAMKGYVTQLKQTYKRSGLILVEVSVSRAPDGAVPFMGSRYWRISYTLFNESKKQAEAAFIDYVTKTSDGTNYRLRFSAPPGVSDQYAAVFERELSLFMLD